MSDDKEAIDLAERRIDAEYLKLPLSVDSHGIAVWLLLTAVEDALRLPLVMHNRAFDHMHYVGLADSLKYGLKHALSSVGARSYSTCFRRTPRTVNLSHCAQAGQLLFRGMDYQAAVATFSSYRAGMSECRIVNDELAFRPMTGRDIRLRARDMLETMAGAGHVVGASPLNAMIRWLREGAPQSVVDHIKKTASISGDHVKYSSTPEGDVLIFNLFGEWSTLIPDDWHTPYGNKSTIQLVLRAILALHALHCLTVNTVAWSRRGGCMSSIVLAISRQELVQRIHALTSVDRSAIAEIVDLLVYGSGNVNSPDPALQPFYAADKITLLSAPMFICSSDLERNFLTLLTRVAPRAFDSASDAFERQMTDRLKNSFDKPEWRSVFNRNISAIRSVGEVDCLLLDTVGRTMLLLELWWQIPPGETREVANREKTALEKANQANRKVTAVRANIAAVLEFVGLPIEDGWTAHALLVSESFLPSGKNVENIPVISRRALQGLLAGPHSRLIDVWNATQTEVWVPREGSHFTTGISHHTLGGIRFSNLRLLPTLEGILFAYISMDGNPPLHLQVE
jgi:hypothetical protein